MSGENILLQLPPVSPVQSVPKDFATCRFGWQIRKKHAQQLLSFLIQENNICLSFELLRFADLPRNRKKPAAENRMLTAFFIVYSEGKMDGISARIRKLGSKDFSECFSASSRSVLQLVRAKQKKPTSLKVGPFSTSVTQMSLRSNVS
ncbi:hypothetical protein M4D70_25495 [Brevibacillus borstelensis]|uniref:hypothetical protein n=1 Tax=Brevibacillus borstelensis TaxID=45462 RepID=UPI0020426BE3|nr:hypothetical protein [Brevibacillus borstelensis]MCM3625536.1 hypothetical protein [Brevibacillus borstelensis]